jgi:nicotinic acid mononucleotide adenylyltransferase/predicted RNA-binding protein with PIN domain
VSDDRRGVYPGSFDPFTIAHLAIAEAAVHQASLDRIDLVISRVALAKEDDQQHPIDERVAAIVRASASRPWLHAYASDAQLIVELARGYDAVVMGSDKWAQVRDPRWYDGDATARDAAVAALPRVLVVPRPGFEAAGAQALDIADELGAVSSTRARGGEHHLIVPEARRRLLVDGNNVIGSRPDGWWRDRAGASRRLVAELQARAQRTGDRIAVVLDGRPVAGLPEGVHEGVLVAYARRAGRDAADDRIVEEVAHDRDPSSLTVVTSDRALAERVRAHGAHVEGASTISRGSASERR